jgi:hypothetical protein
MSERETIQNTLAEYLEQNVNKFDAPYGIIRNLADVKSGGKVRTVTFGVARYLDATIYIWSPKQISVKCEGALSYKVGGIYSSVNEILNVLKNF